MMLKSKLYLLCETRDGKHTSVHEMLVNIFFYLGVKFAPNFTVFFCKSEKCCNFALLLSFFLAFCDYVWPLMVLFLSLYGTFWNSFL